MKVANRPVSAYLQATISSAKVHRWYIPAVRAIILLSALRFVCLVLQVLSRQAAAVHVQSAVLAHTRKISRNPLASFAPQEHTLRQQEQSNVCHVLRAPIRISTALPSVF